MTATTLYEDTLQAIQQLEQKEQYKNRKAMLEEYAAITKEIAVQTDKIDDLIRQGKFDEAAEAKNNISLLEKKRDVMQPLYEKRAAEPDYLETDLIELANEVFDTANRHISGLAEQKKELYQKLFDICEAEHRIASEANRCRELLISKNADREFKTTLKFPREYTYSVPRHEANELQAFLENRMHAIRC